MSSSTTVRVRARKGWLVAVIAAAGLIAASCGDDSGGGSAASSGAPTSGGAAETSAPADTSAPATSAAAGEATTVTDYAAYVGGSGAADASLEPIKVGYVSQEGGAIEVGPTHDDGVEIGVKFINEQAGGIGGHPLELVKCYIASTEEEGQQCGQQMANDDAIVAVIEGPIVIGAESMFAALGDKPVDLRCVGERRGHRPTERRRAVRRRAVHPGAVRHVRT